MSRKRYPALQTRREIAEITKRESTFLRLHSLENPFRYLESDIDHITLHQHPSGEGIKVYVEWLKRQPVFGFFSDHTFIGGIKVRECELEIISLILGEENNDEGT